MSLKIWIFTKVCLDDDPEIVNRRDTIMVRLLHACVQSLSQRGMVGLYLDCVKPDDHSLESFGQITHLQLESERLTVPAGFRKWAEYRDLWRQV